MTEELTIDDLVDNFELLGGWEDRYAYLIELGRSLIPMDDALKTDATKVEGCVSQVWMVGGLDEGDPPRLRFIADSDSAIVRGLIAVLQIAYGARTAQEIRDIDIEALFGRLGLDRHLSPNRRNGFYAMVERIHRLGH